MRLRPGAVPGRSVARGPHRRRYRRAECDPQLSPSRSPWVPVPLTPQAPIPQPGRDNGPAGDQARDFATGELAMAQRLTDHVVAAVDEPVLAALVLGKAAQASERGVELVVADDVEVPEGAVDPRDLVTIVGNLIDNAIDAAAAGPPPYRIEVAARVRDGELVLRVADSGTGLEPADVERAFQRGWSTKSDDRLIGRGLGLALVGQAVHRNRGRIDVTSDGGAVFTVRLPVGSS